MNSNGFFISFEGGDGAGKTTLIEKVYAALQARGLSVLKTRAPGGTQLGQAIRALLLHSKEMHLAARSELLLFLADRAQHVEEVIVPALKNKAIVLCDRFNDSTVAYQGKARGFGIPLVEELCDFACHHVHPQLTLYLDIDPKLGLSRVQTAKDRIESEDLLFHQEIRAAYHQIAKKEPARFHLLDASLSPDAVLTQAMALIDARL